MAKMHFPLYAAKIHFGDRNLRKADVEKVLKLTECTTGIEVIIKQVISAVPGNFLKIEFSSVP